MRSIKELSQKREEVATPGEKLVRINSVSSQGGDHQLEPGVKIEVGLGFVIEDLSLRLTRVGLSSRLTCSSPLSRPLPSPAGATLPPGNKQLNF